MCDCTPLVDVLYWNRTAQYRALKIAEKGIFIMLDTIREIVRRAGQIMLDAGLTEGDVTAKPGHANYVTRYDVAVQEFLFQELGAAFPDAAFLGEEGDGSKTVGKGYTFIIDPIDGTSNFICGYQMSAVSVGLALDGEAVLGVVYNPFREEMYWAEKGKGAFLNDQPLHVEERGMKEGLVCFGTSPYNPEQTERTFNAMREVLPRSMDLRRQGSAALDIAYIAANRNVLFFECILSPWDYAAASCILREAGGVLMTMEGTPADFNVKTSILAGTKTAVHEFLKLGV